ncbi:MAG: hypothetical protein IPL29_12610 [Propionivibrio sp.]|nr:hypothetical protein [Propionivibrio sp.]
MVHVLKAEVEKWMAKQGFTFEMHVAKSFQATCSVVDQSQYYSDPITEKLREIDVVARHLAQVGKAIVEFVYVVECKHSIDKPWVMFTHKKSKTYDESLAMCTLPATQNGNVMLLEMAVKHVFEGNYLFEQPDRIGHGITCSLQGNNDIAFNAVHSVISASIGLNRKEDEYSVATGLKGYNPIQVTLPIVVLNGLLFESYLDDNGELKLEEIERGVLLQASTASRGASCRVDVIPAKSLPKYIEGIDTGWKALRPAIENDLGKMKEIVQRERGC